LTPLVKKVADESINCVALPLVVAPVGPAIPMLGMSVLSDLFTAHALPACNF